MWYNLRHFKPICQIISLSVSIRSSLTYVLMVKLKARPNLNWPHPSRWQVTKRVTFAVIIGPHSSGCPVQAVVLTLLKKFNEIDNGAARCWLGGLARTGGPPFGSGPGEQLWFWLILIKTCRFWTIGRRLPVEIAINGDMWGENNRKIIKTISICCIVVSIMTYIVFTFNTERKYIKAPDYL